MSTSIPKILLATDLSEPASKAAEVAVAEARRRGGWLHVLHVVRSPAQVPAGSAAVAQLVARLRTDVPTVPFTSVGSPAATIVRFAEGEGIDLIVVGGHGHTGVTPALLGSVAERVARTSTCPVLVVPCEREAARPERDRCILCGMATEDLVCPPCRANIRAANGAAHWAARGTSYAGELDRSQCEQVLHTALIGHLGCCARGRIYVVPMAYAYDDGAVYFRSAEGTKARMMRESPSVCLQVDHIVDLASWRSVIVWGIFHELHGEEASRGLQRIMRRMLAWTGAVEGRPPPSFTAVNSETGHRSVTSGRDAVVGRIEVTEMTGCYEQR